MISEDQIDTEMYLRDGYPHAVVCKVQLRDGRIGIGIFRSESAAVEVETMDRAARDDALENVPEPAASAAVDGGMVEQDDDLQATLGHPAR